MRLDSGQRAALARVIEATPWGDIEHAILGIEIVLCLAMQATSEDFRLWEAEAEAAGYTDEFSVSNEDVAHMPIRWRLAYVARLLRTIALDFGVGTEFSGLIGARRDDPDTLAPLLRSLCEIVTDPSKRDDVLPAVDDLARSLHDLSTAGERRRGWYLLQAERQVEAILAEIGQLAEAHRGGQT